MSTKIVHVCDVCGNEISDDPKYRPAHYCTVGRNWVRFTLETSHAIGRIGSAGAAYPGTKGIQRGIDACLGCASGVLAKLGYRLVEEDDGHGCVQRDVEPAE